MSRDFRRHGHQAFMAWSQSSLFINMAIISDSSWEDFFSGLVNLLDIYENYSLDINLDFPSAAILFNQLDITVSVLRSVSDSIADLSLPCTDQLQELCSCFSEIQLYRWNRMAEIGRRTTSIADLGPRSAAMSGVGRPKFEIAQELVKQNCYVTFTFYRVKLSNENIFTE